MLLSEFVGTPFPWTNKECIALYIKISLTDTSKMYQSLSHATLMHKLDLKSSAEVYELLMEALYRGILTGKMDHARQVFLVQGTLGRDVSPVEIQALGKTLSGLQGRVGGTLKALTDQMSAVDARLLARDASLKADKASAEQSVERLKGVTGGSARSRRQI